MKREDQVLIRVTPAEKQMLQDLAEAEGTNVAQMLRFLGLHADKFSVARESLLELTSWLNHLKFITSSTDIAASSEDIQATVDKAIAPIRSLEEALSLPREIES